MDNNNRRTTVAAILRTADKLFRKLLPAVPQEILELDITMPQLKIMIILFIHGPGRMSDLATGLGVTTATATGLVDKLVERSFVSRESLPEDRRVVLCQLTEDGQDTVRKIWEKARERIRELLDTMDTNKLEMLEEVLATMLESAEYQVEQDGKSGRIQRK
jgi:DNA-binding MarR family transcriptional regulator